MTVPFDNRLQRLERDLAAELTPERARGLIERRQGVVASVNITPANTVDVTVGGETILGVRYKAWYTPTVGDVVFVEFVDTDVVVDGPLA